MNQAQINLAQVGPHPNTDTLFHQYQLITNFLLFSHQKCKNIVTHFLIQIMNTETKLQFQPTADALILSKRLQNTVQHLRHEIQRPCTTRNSL